jgi:hypothetical protein
MFSEAIDPMFHTRTRAEDPETSAEAAKCQTEKKRALVRTRVLELFKGRGPMTDRLLVVAYRNLYGQTTPESTIRTRRAELVDEKRVGELTKLTGPRPQTVWKFLK